MTFKLKSTRDAFISMIKETSVEGFLKRNMKDEVSKNLLEVVCSIVFDRLSDDDYQCFYEELESYFDYEQNDVWEIYLDKNKDEPTNDNYSCFIRSNKKPTKTETRKCLKRHNMLQKGYNILSISESNWDGIAPEDIWEL